MSARIRLFVEENRQRLAKLAAQRRERLTGLCEAALTAQEWVKARSYLDDLARDGGATRRIPDAYTFGLPSDHGYHPVVQDRIKFANSRGGLR